MAAIKVTTLIKIFVVAVIWLVVLAIGIPVTLWIAPDLQAKFFPVIGNQSAINAHRSEDGRFFMWEWKFDKWQRGRLDRIGFLIYRHEIDKYTTRVFVGWDCKDDFRTWRVTPAGVRRSVKLCAVIPPALAKESNLSVEGFGEYLTSHPFWLVPVTLPVARENGDTPDDGTEVTEP